MHIVLRPDRSATAMQISRWRKADAIEYDSRKSEKEPDVNYLERNQQIYAMRKQGESIRSLAEKFGLSSGRIASICAQMTEIEKARPLPPGISLKTANAVELAFGMWPSADTAQEIAKRQDEWLRYYGIGLKQVAQLKAWLSNENLR